MEEYVDRKEFELLKEEVKEIKVEMKSNADLLNSIDKINLGVNVLAASSSHGMPVGSDLYGIAKTFCEMLKEYYYNAGYTQIQVPDHAGSPGSLITLSLTEIFDVATLIEALPYNSASQIIGISKVISQFNKKEES